MSEFVTSVPAQAAARVIVETARNEGLLNDAVAVAPELAETEKELFIKMFRAVDEHIRDGEDELSADEIGALFTFVFAKAAEVVTEMFNGKEHQLDLAGMFGGEIPLYADDSITAEFKNSQFPMRCAENYLDFIDKNSDALRGCQPWLLLFEALKWCFRISCHFAATVVEHHHRLS